MARRHENPGARHDATATSVPACLEGFFMAHSLALREGRDGKATVQYCRRHDAQAQGRATAAKRFDACARRDTLAS